MSDVSNTPNNYVDQGALKVQVVARGVSRPISNAKISVSFSGDPDAKIEEVQTDDSGMSEQLTLDTPPLEYSMEPRGNMKLLQTIIIKNETL